MLNAKKVMKKINEAVKVNEGMSSEALSQFNKIPIIQGKKDPVKYLNWVKSLKKTTKYRKKSVESGYLYGNLYFTFSDGSRLRVSDPDQIGPKGPSAVTLG